MIKKKLLALGVSAVTVTAVAGAGFAGWVFGEDADAQKNFGVHVTAAYTFGEVEFDTDQPDTVVLDQSGITLAKTGALTTAIDNVEATWTVSTAAYEEAEANLTYAVNVYVKDALAAYVNCGTTTAETTTDMTGYTQYKIDLTIGESAITESGDSTVVTMTLANPFEYITDAKPGSFADYQTMVAAITGDEADSVTTDTEYDAAADDALVIIKFTVSKTTD